MVGNDRGSGLDAVRSMPSSIAAGTPPGMPKSSVGIRSPASTELLAPRGRRCRGVTLAELALVLRGGDGLPVGEPGAGGRADAGQNTGPDADGRSPQDVCPVGEPLLDSVEPAARQFDHFAGLVALADAGCDLGEAEDAQRHGDQGQAIAEEQAAEREAVLRGRRRCAHHAEQQPEQAGCQALCDVPRESTAAKDTLA